LSRDTYQNRTLDGEGCGTRAGTRDVSRL
jgi:hypothetical protein